jgi:phage-related protein (TIGR01555 family)
MSAKKVIKNTETKEKKYTAEEMTQFWHAVSNAVKTENKSNDGFNPLNGNIKVQLREPHAMHTTIESGKYTTKMMKASAIYDSVMRKDERYTFNDVDYNPYGNQPMSIPSNSFFNSLNSLVINNFFIGYGELALISQNPILSNICQIRAHEIVSKWIRIVSNGDKDRTKEIKILEDWFKKRKIRELFKNALDKAFKFGGCIVYISIKGDDDNSHDLDTSSSLRTERENPLLIDNLQIGKGSINDLVLIEPTWYTAVNWQSMDPLRSDFYKPQKYTLLGRLTHATRLMHFKYKEVPDILKPTYMFNGQPLTQELLPYLMGFEQARNNINKLIGKYNHFVLKTGIEQLLNSSDNLISAGQNLGTRIAMFNQIATSNNVVAIEKTAEEFENIQINLNGVAEPQNLNMLYLSSLARIPVTKLFQNSLPGMNPTGEFETNSYHDTIRQDQANMADDHMHTVLQLGQLDCFGELMPDITFEWNPLGAANELETAEIKLKGAQEIANLVSAGIVIPLQAAKKLQSDKKSGWDNLEIKESDYPKGFAEEKPMNNKSENTGAAGASGMKTEIKPKNN